MANNPGTRTYYVQLIRANNSSHSPEPKAVLVGEKLGKRLRPVFNWTSFWQVSCQTVQIRQGSLGRVRLSQVGEVEIDLSEPGKRKVTAYREGKPVARTICPILDEMSIAGGERDADSVWFIVVREDNPIATD